MQSRTAVVDDSLRQIQPVRERIAKKVQDVPPEYSQPAEAGYLLKANLSKGSSQRYRYFSIGMVDHMFVAEPLQHCLQILAHVMTVSC
jgi:hypothetical protein